jgi:hypothetical protein
VLAGPIVRENGDGRTIRIWEQNESMRAQPREKDLPEARLLPGVYVIAPGESLSRQAAACGEAMLEAGRPEIRSLLRARRLIAGVNGELAQARILESWVQNHIQSDGNFDCANLATAEETLQSGLGSRTAAFFGLAQAAGVRADIVLSKKLGADDEPRRYSHPLVELQGKDGPLFLDVETANNSFGDIPTALDRNRGLRLQLRAANDNGGNDDPPSGAEPAGPLFLQLPREDSHRERSEADGSLVLTPQGELQADLSIRLGASRGAQVRGRLRGASPAARQQYMAQLAGRILPGAVDVSGSIENSDDRDRPLVVRLRCRVPEFATPARSTVDLSRLLPALGLPRMYAAKATRSLPMLIDDVLVEGSRFRLHLPAGISAEQLPPAARVGSRFGEFRLEIVKKGTRDVEIIRQFDIPAQVVSAREYADFRAFANRVEQSERKQITFLWKPGSAQGPL